MWFRNLQCSLSVCLIWGNIFAAVLCAPAVTEGEVRKDDVLPGNAGQGVLTQGEIVQTEPPQVNLTQDEGRAIASGNGQIITYPTHETDVHQRTAVVELTPSSLEHPVTGTLRLTEVKFGVQIEGKIFGLTPGSHGFHIHEKGDTGNSCLAAGPHFNPFNKTHGSKMSVDRHLGDLGNIEAPENGPTLINVFDDKITLDPNSERSVYGRTFIVHEKSDDFGQGGDPESLKTGSAGLRLACGIVTKEI